VAVNVYSVFSLRKLGHHEIVIATPAYPFQRFSPRTASVGFDYGHRPSTIFVLLGNNQSSI
jgi:hypothetical protein